MVERELKEVESVIREKYPGAAFIELEPDSLDADTFMLDSISNLEFRSDEAEEIAEIRKVLRGTKEDP